jgi:hypothetical protein
MHGKFLHIAYNLNTGEVIMTQRGNQLKRLVARNERWNIINGYGTGNWRFVHGADCEQKMAKKLGGDR